MTDNDVRLRLAVEDGIITQNQADRVAAIRPRPPADGRRWQAKVSPATEVVGYLGAILAMAGVSTLVADEWGELAPGSRVALLGAVAVAFLVAGLLVRNEEVDEAASRLRTFLLLLSTVAVAGAAGLLGGDVLDWSPEATLRLVGGAVAVESLLLWARSAARPAQHLTTFGGLVTLTAATVAELDSAGGAAIVLWVLGGAWLLAGWRGVLPPPEVALGLGGLTMLISCLVLAGSWPSLAPLAGLATGAGLLAAGAQGRRPILTGLGVVGVLVFTPYTIVYFFGDTVGVPVAFLVGGGLLLALTMYHLRHGRAGAPPVATS